MMHRYVAVVSTQLGGVGFDRVVDQLGRRFGDAGKVADGPLAAVWVFAQPPSRLGSRPLRGGGCVIGLDFRPDAHDPETLLADTWGAYVAVAVDAAAQTVTVLRDPTGRIACWRLRLEGAEVLFSHYEDVYGLQARPSVIDWAYLAHFLSQDWLQGADTGLEGVTEVLPGERLRYVRGRVAQAMRWWPHEIAAAPHPSLEAAQGDMRAAAEAAVAAWARPYERVSIDLSGGLDSAIVLGLLRASAGHPDVIGLNLITPGAEGDERLYARAAAARHGIELVERQVESHAFAFGTSRPRQFPRPAAPILESGYNPIRAGFALERGREAAFTGIGGDHLFFIDLQVDAACDYLQLGGDLRGFVETSTFLAQLSRDTVWNCWATVARRCLGRDAGLRDAWTPDNPFLSAPGRAAADFERYTHPWALAAREAAPPAKLRQIAALVHLQKLYVRAGRAEVTEETHPLVSQPLIESCLRTPAPWFGVGGVQRGLARRAFADLIPTIIRERRSKGGSSVYFAQFAARRLPQLRELLLEGRLAQQGLLDRARLDAELTPLALAASRQIQPLYRCLLCELWVRRTETDHAAAVAEARRAVRA